MPIIGIVYRSEFNYYKVNQDYVEKINKYGGIPILILPTKNIDKILSICNGILMPGGDEINEYDKYICDYANKKQIPLFGICLGMQIMDIYNNNSDVILINSNIDHHQKDKEYVHSVTINKNSKLYEIIGEETFLVNSNHNYQITNNNEYKVVGISNDNIIEAIEKDGVFNIGVEWHPERLNDSISEKLFKAFIESL